MDLSNLSEVMRKLKEVLGTAEIAWVDQATLRVALHKQSYEYEIVVKCSSDVACYRLRRAVALLELVSLLQ